MWWDEVGSLAPITQAGSIRSGLIKWLVVWGDLCATMLVNFFLLGNRRANVRRVVIEKLLPFRYAM